MIDTHCHIAGDEFAGDLNDVVARAQGAGLTEAIVIIAADDAADDRIETGAVAPTGENADAHGSSHPSSDALGPSGSTLARHENAVIPPDG